MSPQATNVLLAVSAGIISLFCTGFAAAQIVSPQTLLGGLLP